MLARVILAVTSATSLRLIGLVGLLGWAIAFAVWTAQLPPTSDDGQEAIGGDLISFYTAGTLLLHGQGASLYDLKLQYDTQHVLIGNPEAQSLCSYVNPPLLAIVMAPLALLPLKAAFVGYSMLAFAAFWGGMWLLRSELRIVREHWVAAVGLGFLFPPFCVSITGGQNTALSFLLISGLYVFLRRGRVIAAGVMLGLLSYKPQLGFLIGVLLLVRGEWRVASVAALTVAAHFVGGALVCGWDWPVKLQQTLQNYWPLEHQFNGFKSIALLGACQFMLPEEWWRLVGGGISAALALGAAVLWRRTPIENARFPALYAATVALTLTVSPHTVWYDAGLLLVPCLLLLDLRCAGEMHVSAGTRLVLVAAFFLPACFGFGAALGWQPVAALPLAVLACAAADYIHKRGTAEISRPSCPPDGAPLEPSPAAARI